ncbi:MAG: hypothetical protein PVF28_06725, partial [Thioalkalispiraceae bacterium]
MDENDDILSNLWVFISDINHPENWLQIGILAVSLGLAFLIAHFIGKFLFEQTVELDTRNFKRITFRSLKRILFPLTALIVVLISRGILQRYEQPVQLLNFAVPLLLSLGGIRLLIYILRKAFKPSPLLKAWENIISISVWIIVALYLLDLLPAVRKSLQSIGFKIGSSQFTLLSIVESVVYIAIFFT